MSVAMAMSIAQSAQTLCCATSLDLSHVFLCNFDSVTFAGRTRNATEAVTTRICALAFTFCGACKSARYESLCPRKRHSGWSASSRSVVANFFRSLMLTSIQSRALSSLELLTRIQSTSCFPFLQYQSSIHNRRRRHQYQPQSRL